MNLRKMIQAMLTMLNFSKNFMKTKELF